MKVVLKSNFDDETVKEQLLKDDLTPDEAFRVSEDWNNENASANSRYFAVIRTDEYRLWRGMADLVGE